MAASIAHIPTQGNLDEAACERAYLSGDARFDGRFFIGVRTTGIYCRPVCPVKPPKRENIAFYPSAAAAAAAGLRPCLRCRPELSPGTPDWSGASATVSRALRMIAGGVADDGGVGAIAAGLGLTPRHLQRLFQAQLGASPLEVIRTRRLHLAKRLIDETDITLAEVAFAAGFGSVRRFNATFQALYGRAPSALRRAAPRRGANAAGEPFEFRLAYRPPFDWRRLLAFFAVRATPGVEALGTVQYSRCFRIGDALGTLAVEPDRGTNALSLRVRCSVPGVLLEVVERVRRVFDLGADPGPIRAHLRRDRALRPWVDRMPGVRVPGAWDGFELVVRAVLGQQVSVKGATTIAGRIAARCGEPLPVPEGPLTRVFPTPQALLGAELDNIGMPGARARTIRLVAEAVLEGRLVFDGADPERLAASLVAIPGIGAWTAQYVALRLGEPDAFPASDLGLLKSAANDGADTARRLLARSDAWRPWRAYAALVLWNATGRNT